MDNGARNWMFKYARKNYWRVASWMDLDDLIQEGYAAYYETRKRYPTATEPKHIMSLFALVFRSKIEIMVRAKKHQVDSPEGVGTSPDSHGGINKNGQNPSKESFELDCLDFNMLLLKAPDIIKEILALFTTEENCKELAKPFVVYDNGKRETPNERFCRLLGKDPNCTNVEDQLRAYFS